MKQTAGQFVLAYIVHGAKIIHGRDPSALAAVHMQGEIAANVTEFSEIEAMRHDMTVAGRAIMV